MVSRWSGHLSAPLRLNVCRGPCLRKTVVPACRSILRGGRRRRVSARRRRGERRTLFRCAGSGGRSAGSFRGKKGAALHGSAQDNVCRGDSQKASSAEAFRRPNARPAGKESGGPAGNSLADGTPARGRNASAAGMRPRQKCVRRRNRRRIGSTASFFSPVRPCAGPDRKLGSAGIPGVAQTGSRRFRALMRPAFFPPTEPEGVRPARLRPCALRPRRSFPRLRGRVPPAGSADRRRG